MQRASRLVAALLPLLAVASSVGVDEKLFTPLHHANFQALVMDQHMVVAVVFHTTKPEAKCKTCNQFLAAATENAKQLKGLVNFGYVSLDEDVGQRFARGLNVSNVPWMLVFRSDSIKSAPSSTTYVKKPDTYHGLPDAQAMHEFLLERLTEHHIVKIRSDADYTAYADLHEQQMPKFPKFLLFTNTEDTPLEWIGLSNEFRYRAHFAVVPTSFRGRDSEFSVTSRPAVRVLIGSDKERYNGKFSIESVRPFLEFYASHESIRKAVHDKLRAETDKLYERDVAQATAPRFSGAIVAKDANVLQRECFALDTFCFVVYANPADSAFDRHVETMRTVGAELSKNLVLPLVVVVVDSTKNGALMNFFEVLSGVPTVTFINTKVTGYFNWNGVRFDKDTVIRTFEARMGKYWDTFDASFMPEVVV